MVPAFHPAIRSFNSSKQKHSRQWLSTVWFAGGQESLPCTQGPYPSY